MQPVRLGAQIDRGDLLAVARPLPAAHPAGAQAALACSRFTSIERQASTVPRPDHSAALIRSRPSCAPVFPEIVWKVGRQFVLAPWAPRRVMLFCQGQDGTPSGQISFCPANPFFLPGQTGTPAYKASCPVPAGFFLGFAHYACPLMAASSSALASHSRVRPVGSTFTPIRLSSCAFSTARRNLFLRVSWASSVPPSATH